jgi:hypothetical protein
MDFGSINWLTVVACVLAAMISGWIWFSPGVFFPAWWKGIGREGTPGMGDYGNLSMGVTWGLTILSSVVQGVFAVLFIPLLANALGGLSLATGLQAGFWLWLGIIAPTNLVNKLFAGYELKVWMIEAGNHLLNFLLFGAIIGLWG